MATPIYLLLLALTVLEGTLCVQLDCDGFNDTYTRMGTNVNFTCNTSDAALVGWNVPPSHIGPDDAVGFSDFSSVGQSQTIGDGIFTATYSQAPPSRTSIIQFTVTPSLNGTSVTCADGGSPPGDESCFILVISTPESPPDLINITSTYESVQLRWAHPFNGGSPIIRYHIDVDPVPSGQSNCTGGQCNTTELSYNVTGLSPNVQHQFTVRAENSEGIGEGASVNVTTVGNVFPPLANASGLCLNYTNNGLMLGISWNCDSAVGNSTTPPLTHYTVCVNSTCSPVLPGTCSVLVPVECSNMYMVNVTLGNRVGASQPSPVATINTDLLGSIIHNDITNESVRISYTLFTGCNDFTSNADLEITLTNVNTSSVESLNYMYTSGAVTISSLNDSTQYSYSLLVTVDGNDVCMGTHEREGQFITLTDEEIGGGTTTTTITTTTTTTTTASADMSPFPSSTTTPPITGGLERGAVIGIAIGGALILLGIIIIVVVLLAICLKSKKGEKANFNRRSRGSDEPIALMNRTEPVPETGQALYQDPDTIQREKAPTGDMYAVPDKGPRRNAPTNTTPAPHQPELATYQDPNTIQREQAPTGDLYALPDKKPVYSQVNKENTGIVYAELGLENTAGAGPGYSSNTVLYADVNVNK